MSTGPKKFDGLAANFMDRIEKLRKTNDAATTQNPLNTKLSTSSSSSTSSLPLNLFNNLAYSFNKSRDKIDITCTPTEIPAKSTNTSTEIPAKSATHNNLVVIDDMEFDDPYHSDEFTENEDVPRRLSKSYSTNSNPYNGSTSAFEITENQSVGINPRSLDLATTSKLPPSTSLYQVFDELTRSNATIHNLVDEAEHFKKRFLVKKKSLEVSIENFQGSKNKIMPASVDSGDVRTDNLEVDVGLVLESKLGSVDNLEKVDIEVGDVVSDFVVKTPVVVESVEPIFVDLQNNEMNVRQIKHQPTLTETLMDLIHSQLTKHKHLAFPILALLIAYLVILPRQWHYFTLTYAFGTLTGLAIAALIIYTLFKLDLLVQVTNAISSSSSSCKSTQEIVPDDKKAVSDLNEQVHSLLIQTALLKESKSFDGVYKGWMNELREKYSPDDYFLNKTRSVYVNLDGTMLRIQTTNSRVPKRATCDEKLQLNLTFNKLRIYDLTNCTIQILPLELCRKRYWSKKYPLTLTGVKLISSSTNQNKASSPSIRSQSIDSSNLVAEEMSPASSFDKSLESDRLILFARTDREKEEWFKLFNKSASKSLQSSTQFSQQTKKKDPFVSNNKDLTKIVSNNIDLSNLEKKISYSTSNDKIIYKLNNGLVLPELVGPELESTKSMDTQTDNGLIYDSSLAFMNTFLIRLFADFFTHQYWIDKIQTKMQNKLNTIKLPYFMESLNIINLNLGSVVPLIKQASEPWYDEKGLWVHLDIDYSGGVEIIISTKLNLMKLKANGLGVGNLAQSPTATGTPSPTVFSFKNEPEPSLTSRFDKPENNELKVEVTTEVKSERRAHLAIVESEAEDSPESSGDEYTHDDFTTESERSPDGNKLVETANTSKKLLNFVSKIAASNYFQKATENKYIKMAMENVSNCQLNLNVEVKKISGKIALNIPPHPSDRIWYGFVEKPQMILIATPQVGDKEVSYAAISDWIADKLKQEFQKVLVFPNMDDFYIPILNSQVNYRNW